MNILYSTAANHSCIVKVFFVGIHYGSCWEKFVEFVSRAEVTLQILSHPLDSLFLDLHNHLLEELIPFSLFFIYFSFNY